MNERIRALLEQSTKQINPDDREWVFSKVDQEKFAELIVQECCSKLAEMGDSWHEFSRNPPRDQVHTASSALFAAYRLKEDAVWELKEHFGIAE